MNNTKTTNDRFNNNRIIKRHQTTPDRNVSYNIRQTTTITQIQNHRQTSNDGLFSRDNTRGRHRRPRHTASRHGKTHATSARLRGQ